MIVTSNIFYITYLWNAIHVLQQSTHFTPENCVKSFPVFSMGKSNRKLRQYRESMWLVYVGSRHFSKILQKSKGQLPGYLSDYVNIREGGANLAQNVNDAVAAKPRYLRSEVLNTMEFIQCSGDSGVWYDSPFHLDHMLRLKTFPECSWESYQTPRALLHSSKALDFGSSLFFIWINYIVYIIRKYFKKSYL